MFGKKKKRKSWFSKSDSTKEEIYEYTSTRITINGKEIEGDFGDINDSNLIQQVAEQLNLSQEEAAKLINKTAISQNQQERPKPRRTGLLKRFDCPQCQRKVTNNQTYCLYCGHELTEQQEDSKRKSTTNMVDEKYLNKDIDDKAETKQKSKQKDSFLQRILRM